MKSSDDTYSTKVAPDARGKSAPVLRIRDARTPAAVFPLLTAREARKRFGLRKEHLYHAAATGLIHPVRPNGRVLYPEWELRAIIKWYYRRHQVREAA